jgi:basic membrane lipoprotein Med (substrate-binding protein (PBP1-ABC) superfamily)
VLTSAEKKIPRAVFLTVKEVVEDNFQAGTETFGLQDEAVGISDFHYFDDVVPQAVRDELDAARQEIRDGTVDIKQTRDGIGR